MRFLVQRVNGVNLYIDGKLHSKTNRGYLCYIGFTQGDTFETVNKGLNKLFKLRIFEDSEGKINKALSDIDGEVMFVSSFSLYADTKGSNRPSFTKSLNYNESIVLYNYLKEEAMKIFKCDFGEFGADMKVESVNDGPISIIMDI